MEERMNGSRMEHGKENTKASNEHARKEGI